MLLLPLLDYLPVARPSLCFLCLLHGPPLLILGRWALQPCTHKLGDSGVLIGVSLLAGLCRAQTFTTSHFAPFCVLVYASSVLFWLPPFPVVPPRLSYNYGTGLYVVACQLHAVSLYDRMAHWSPIDIVGCAPWCGKGIHKISVRVYVSTSEPAVRSTALARCWHENNGRIG